MKTILKFDIESMIIKEPTCVVFYPKNGFDNTQRAEFELRGDNAALLFIGIIFAQNSDSFIIETNSLHQTPNTKAHFFVRSALFDKSSLSYHGNIRVEKDALDCDVYLEHKSLVFSSDAHIKTTPALEIEPDDVKAKHAATIGKIDDETLYYLQTRGLPRKAAQDLLIRGFFDELVSLIPDKKIQSGINTLVTKSLPF